MDRWQWFIDCIGKRVWRNEHCNCENCQYLMKNGVLILDKQHANYLYELEAECGYKYYDSKEEMDNIELNNQNNVSQIEDKTI